MNLNNNTRMETVNRELEINNGELENMLKQAIKPALVGREAVPYNKSSLVNLINAHLAKEKEKFNHEKVIETYNRYINWRKNNEAFNQKGDAVWEKIRNKNNSLINDIINEKTELNNSNITSVKEFIQINRENILTDLDVKITTTQNKPQGVMGDLTLNELANTGLAVFYSPLVKMIKEHVDIKLISYSVTSLIRYKTVMKIFMKSAYSQGSIPAIPLTGPCTRPQEIILFMLLGAPAIFGTLMGIIYFTWGGSKVIENIVENTDLDGANSSSSSSSFFLFLNKLPSWLKIILKYIAFSVIITFITSVIGYKSNILAEVYSQLNTYFIIFFKLYSILNFLLSYTIFQDYMYWKCLLITKTI
jgi:hypothetical protein